MKINKLAQRLQKDRPMKMVSILIPEDVVDDLKRVAPMLGFSGYQATDLPATPVARQLCTRQKTPPEF
jgi:hypothetical protein